MTPYELMELLESAQLKTRSYSGRGMDGKDCPAFIVESIDEILMAGLLIVQAADDAAMSARSVEEVFRNTHTDDLAKRKIVYFPRYTFEAAK